MNVGDKMQSGAAVVEVVKVEPDSNGRIVVMVTDGDGAGFYSTANLNELEPLRATWRATHPDYGQVTIELPVDGVQEVRAVWSKTAADLLRG